MIENTLRQSVISAILAWREAMLDPSSGVREWPDVDELADVAGVATKQVQSELSRLRGSLSSCWRRPFTVRDIAEHLAFDLRRAEARELQRDQRLDQ
jgi:hypothetical protein